MKKILFLLFILFSFSAGAQVYQEMPQYGYRANRMSFDSTLQIPTTCGVPTLKSVINVSKKAAIAFDSCNKRFYYYDPKLQQWDTIKGGGASIDTTSLSNRINSKLNISDTANMLSKYLRKVDTASLSSRINNKVDSIKKSSDSIYYWVNGSKFFAYKDSAGGSGSGFVPYTGATQDVDLGNNGLDARFIKVTGTAGNGHIDLKHQSGDATGQANSTKLYANANGYLKWKNDNQYYSTLAMPQTANRVYTFENKNYTLGDSADISARVKYTDTASMLSPYARSINVVKYSDTASMLSKYLRKSDTASLSNRINSLNLQKVTDNGDTTNHSLFVNGLNLYDVTNDYYGNFIYSDNAYILKNGIGENIFNYEPGLLTMKNGNGKVTTLNNENNTNNRLLYLPDISGTFALRGDSSIFQTKYKTDTMRTNIYNTLIGKQDKITLTTTGTSGAATLVGSTLNIPQYSGGSSYTFSTGLTNTSGTITNNLSTGVSGGQSVIGGTAASNNLTLSSTSNATKGKILFGNSAFNESNNRLGIGTASPQNQFDIVRGTAGTMARSLYETGSFSNNGDNKVGLYNAQNEFGLGGVSLVFGNTNVVNDFGYYPGFEMQFNGSFEPAENFVTFNYLNRDTTGAVMSASTGLLNIYQDGKIKLNASGLSAQSKLLIGEDADGSAILDVDGTGKFSNTLKTKGQQLGYRWIGSGDNTVLSTTDHIILTSTGGDGNLTLTLPTAVEGQNIIIKKVDDEATIIINPASGNVIAESDPYVLSNQYQYVNIVADDGGTWWIIGGN